MRLELASYKAIKYACLRFHYAKAIPIALCSFSVFNILNEWCGVIIYSTGANKNLGVKFGLSQGHWCELARVALNGKQESTSKAISISLKLLQKHNPLVKLVISYADCDQEHVGTIYQATNWIYEGLVQQNGGTPKFRIDGKVTHGRTIGKRGWKQNLEWIRKNKSRDAEIVYTKGKHKYLFPLSKDILQNCKSLGKPYPKKQAAEVLSVAR